MYLMTQIEKFLDDHAGLVCPIAAELARLKAAAASQKGIISGGQIEEIMGCLAPAFIKAAQTSDYVALAMQSDPESCPLTR